MTARHEIDAVAERENIIEVLPTGPFDTGFFYLSEEVLAPGDIVEIPFGNRKILGMVIGNKAQLPSEIKLKAISKKYDFSIEQLYRDFIWWVAAYTLIPRGNILKMILCEKSVFQQKKERQAKEEKTQHSEKQADIAIQLNEEQQKAYELIKNSEQKPFLLQGVTGSGKTEVYLSVIRDILAENKQALILLPEIALTSQLSGRIERYFGLKPIIWNSSITPNHRKIAWIKAISGEKIIVIGTRSALFLPFKRLGAIVVDEEHDSSYKQEENGSYNARDMAVVLADFKKIPIILTSATPSLESYVNAKTHKYNYAFIKNRFGVAQNVPIKLIDMRQCKFFGNFLSQNLLDAIKEKIQKGEQSLIYLNRRGYSPITLCKSCGRKIACPNCSCWLVYHKKLHKMICHYCGHKSDIPEKCDHCNSEDSYIQFGPGVERIQEEISKRIPSAKILLVSSDNVVSEKNITEIRKKILNNEVNVIIGTQILAKGHHFPNITLVGVVDGDLGLNCSDLRSSEKTYQLIQQVAGRAGRADKPGEILIQTFSPEHSLYQALKENNITNFINMEIASRKENNLPPFTRLASLIISGTNGELTEETAKKLAKSWPKNEITMFGPAPAPLFLLRGRKRWRILFKSSKKIALSKVIKNWIVSQKSPKNIKIQIDIDPVTFL